MVGAFAAARLIAGFLFGVAPTDPGIVAAAASILMMVGLLAAWLPALRAARVAPINALRHD
jgi:ABC-type antimicrobial peptide transport system permease subunit